MITAEVPEELFLDRRNVEAVRFLESKSINLNNRHEYMRSMDSFSIVFRQRWQDSNLLYRQFESSWEPDWKKRRRLLARGF